MPVNCDAPVVREGEWQSAQPILLNKLAPFWVEGVGEAGVGGAESRIKAAKFTVSDDISEIVPSVDPKLGLLWFPLRILLASSGVGLNRQPATAERSLGNTSLETPCSTL